MPWLAVIGLFAYALAFQGVRGLATPDEGRYTNVALNMIESGEWLTPHLDSEREHLAKPPLTYWLLAASISLFGRNEWAVRLPNAIAFATTVLLVFGIAKTVAPSVGIGAAFIYATCPLVYAAANIVTTDTLLTLWEALAVFGFVAWWSKRQRTHWNLLMWSGFGLAFLTKGPPGLLPTIPMLGWLLAQKHPRALRRFFHPLGIALFCVIGFGWYLQMVIADPSRWDYFIGNEVIGRIFTGVHRRNSEFLGAFYVYLPIIILGPLPWTVPWLIKIWNLRHAACRRLVWQRLRQAEPWTKFLLLWAMIPLVIFFLAKSRLPLYILPLFVPLSLLLAIGSQTRVNRILGHPARMAMLVAFCVLARGAISYPSLHKDSRRIADQLRPLLPSTTSEIVFVDCTAYYGLRFYLGNEVELVQFKPKMPDVELLNDELKRVEPNTAFIVEDKRVKKFLDTAKAREKFVKPIGNYEDLQLFFHPSISKSLNLPQMQTGR